MGPVPAEPDFWGQTYDIDGREVTLGQIASVLNQSRPNYFWGGEVVCSTSTDYCCPAYCCNVLNTVHELQKPMDMSFRERQTASLNGTFQVISWQDGGGKRGGGFFFGRLFKDFEHPIYGGWTLEVHFNKPVFELQSFNARIVGSGDGAKTYFLQPMYWNRDIPKGNRRILVHGLTTPVVEDRIPLTATGALWYSPSEPSAPPPGPGPYKIESRPVPPPAPSPGERYNLAEVLQLSSLFYEAQRSGQLPESQRIKWRGDSCLKDGQDVGKDLTGGYFDAGDHIQFTLTMAYSMTVLIWGLIRYEDAYTAAGELQHMRQTVKWGLDSLVKSHTDENEFYVQISDEVDHCRWGPPETINYLRRSYKVTCANPGSQPVMNAASALAAGSIAFKTCDPSYSAMLLRHAEGLFAFAERCPGDWIKDGRIPAANFYDDGGRYLDEHAFAAAWLHKATGQQHYLDKALSYYYRCCYVKGGQSDYISVLDWADMTMGVNLLLYEALRWGDFKDAIIHRHKAFIEKVYRTPKGLSYYNDWGANRYAANAAFTSLVAAELGFEVDGFRTYAASQIHYMLGDCCGGEKSFLIGFGPSWPPSYHHRAASCKGDDCRCTIQALPHVLWGALLGGPERDDTIVQDGCPDFMHMEVALDFNAGFTSAVAAMKHLSLQGIHL